MLAGDIHNLQTKAKAREREGARGSKREREQERETDKIKRIFNIAMKKRIIYRCAMHNNCLINNLFLYSVLISIFFSAVQHHKDAKCGHICKCLIKSLTSMYSLQRHEIMYLNGDKNMRARLPACLCICVFVFLFSHAPMTICDHCRICNIQCEGN